MSSIDLRLPLSDEEIARLIQAGVDLDDGKVALLENPDLFIAHYFRHRLERLQDFHLRLIASATRHARGLVLYPAAHGKTTSVSTCIPVYDVCRNPDIREALILKNEADATSVMRAIQAELLDNGELIADFGPFKDPEKGSVKTWALGSIEVWRRSIRHPSPTIQVFGSGGNVLGRRADRVRCDDVVTDKNSSTPEQRAKTREWFNLGVETMLENADGLLTVVGTRFHPEDLYGDLIELTHHETGEPIYHVQHEDAIVDEDERVTLWPDRWPWDRLMAQKSKMGTLDFNKRYRNIAVDPERMVFREEYVKGGRIGAETYPGCLDRTFRLGEHDLGWPGYGGFDPAIGLTRGHSWCVHTALARGSCDRHERCLWVIGMKRDTMSLPRQADTIIDEHERLRLVATRIETNAYQMGLKDIVHERMDRRNLRLRIDPHFTGSNKLDPEIGVQAMSPYFERGEVHIPWGDPASRRVMGPLVEELVSYPGRTTDCVMSFWIAFLCAQEMAPRMQSYNRIRRPIAVGRNQVWNPRRRVKNPYYADLKGEAAVPADG